MLKTFLRKLLGIQGTDKIRNLTMTDMNITFHAIRSHMTTIIGFTDVLKDDKRLPEEVKDYLETINKTSWALVAELNKAMQELK